MNLDASVPLPKPLHSLTRQVGGWCTSCPRSWALSDLQKLCRDGVAGGGWKGTLMDSTETMGGVQKVLGAGETCL